MAKRQPSSGNTPSCLKANHRGPLLARSGRDSAANGDYGQAGRYADGIGLVCEILHHKLAQDDIPVERKKGAIGR